MSSMSQVRHLRRATARTGALAAVLAAVVGAGPAHADAPVFGFHDLQITTSTDQAGGHPDMVTSFALNTRHDDGLGYDVPVEALRDVRVTLPAGLVGDAVHLPRCSAVDYGANSCSRDTQVGQATIDVDLGFGAPFPDTEPVYNVAPGDGRPATFGFTVLIPKVLIGFGLRTATDGGLDATIDGISQAARVFTQQLTLWGVPADPSHDAARGGPSAAPRLPLLRNPTACGSTTAALSVDSWEHPDRVVTERVDLPDVSGCADVPFAPTVAIAPETTSADAPTGLDVTVAVPQNLDPDGLASSDLRRAVVTLPAGYTISPSAAGGLQLCDVAHFGIGTARAADCPDASKIGEATIVSPILAKPLTGPIYLGPSPSPGRYQVYVDVAGNGVRIKLPGTIAADPSTGQLTTTFADTPQQPFDTFKLHFDGGPRAVLASPTTCGTTTATATLTPWAAPAVAPVATSAPVALGGGNCPAAAPFSPSVSAGVTNARAGADSGFTLQVARADGTQPVSQISSVTLPPGLVARVGQVPLCPSAAAAAGTCDAASRVGSVAVTAGPGGAPLGLSGVAYLTEGYGGAPYGLSLVVPALAGPFDLGTVVVRSAISVAPDTRITVKTDPLPTILGGIPLRLRSIGLTLDRPGFVVNPTSCGDAAVDVQTAAASGATATAASRFGLTGCRALPFAPALKVTLKPSTKAAGAGLHVALTQKAGQANLRSVGVTLPTQVGIKLKALGTVCTADQLAKDACPAAAQVGGASARTSILKDPLKGPVYLAQTGKTLPGLVAVLRGGGLTVPLTGVTTTTKGGRLVATFATIPDVPITTFDLDLPHTKRSILQTTGLRCSGASALAAFAGQNGAKLNRTSAVAGPCPKPKAKGKSGK